MSKIMFHLNTLEHGGAERVVSNLANEFCKGDDEIIVATEWFGEEEFELDSRVKRIHVGLRSNDEKKGRVAKILLRNKYLKKTIKEEKPDVVIAFAQKAIYRVWMIGGRIKTKIITCVRIDPVAFYSKPIDKLMIRLFNHRSDGAVFQTPDQRDFFPKHLRDVSTIIINPVNEKYHLKNEYETISTITPKSKCIVTHARLVDFKNQPILIDAFMKVHEIYPDYTLKIYGPDSLDGTKEILENKIREYDASSFIQLMGGSDTIEKDVPKCSIYVTSSDYEGMPNSLLEAMCMGMSIVATDCPPGGPRMLMGEPNETFGKLMLTSRGILVPIKNVDALAEGIEYLIENPSYAKEAGFNASKVYEEANGAYIVSKWRKYIENVINQK